MTGHKTILQLCEPLIASTHKSITMDSNDLYIVIVYCTALRQLEWGRLLTINNLPGVASNPLSGVIYVTLDLRPLFCFCTMWHARIDRLKRLLNKLQNGPQIILQVGRREVVNTRHFLINAFDTTNIYGIKRALTFKSWVIYSTGHGCRFASVAV